MIACTCGTTATAGDASDISTTMAPLPHTSPRFCRMSSEDLAPIDDASGPGYSAGCAALVGDMTGNYREYMIARSAARSPAQYPTFVPWGSVAVEPMDCWAFVSTNTTMAEFLQSFKPACCDRRFQASCPPGTGIEAAPHIGFRLDFDTLDILAAYNMTCEHGGNDGRRGCNLDVSTFLGFLQGYNAVGPRDEPIRMTELLNGSRWPPGFAEAGREFFNVAVFAPIETAWATWASTLDGSLGLGLLERYVDTNTTSPTLLNHIAPLSGDSWSNPLNGSSPSIPQNESFTMLGGAVIELRVRQNSLGMGQDVAEVFIQGGNGAPVATVLKTQMAARGIIYFVDAVLRVPEGPPEGPDHPVNNGTADTGYTQQDAGELNYVDCNASHPCGPRATCQPHGVCVCDPPRIGNGAICVAQPLCRGLDETACSQAPGCQMENAASTLPPSRVCGALVTPSSAPRNVEKCRAIPSGTPLRADSFSPRTWVFFSAQLSRRPSAENEFTVVQNLSALPVASTARSRTDQPLYPRADWVTNVPGMLCPINVSNLPSHDGLPLTLRPGTVTPLTVVSRSRTDAQTGLQSHWTVPNGHCHVGEQSSSGPVRTTGSHSWNCQDNNQYLVLYVYESPNCTGNATRNTFTAVGPGQDLFRKGDTRFVCVEVHATNEVHTVAINGRRAEPAPLTVLEYDAIDVNCMSTNPTASTQTVSGLCMSSDGVNGYVYTAVYPNATCDGRPVPVTIALYPDDPECSKPPQAGASVEHSADWEAWPTLIWQDRTTRGCIPMYGDETNPNGSRRTVICGQRAPVPTVLSTVLPAGPRTTSATAGSASPSADVTTTHSTTTTTMTAAATATTTTTAQENRNANRHHSGDHNTMSVGELLGVGAVCVIALIVIVGVIVRENRAQFEHVFPYSSFHELSATTDEYSSTDSSDPNGTPPPPGLAVPAMFDANGNSLFYGDVDALATIAAKRARIDTHHVGPVGNDGMMYATPSDDPRRAGMPSGHGQVINGVSGMTYIGNAGLGVHNGVHLGGQQFNVGPNTMAETQFSCAPAPNPLPMLPAGIDLMSIPGIGMLNQATLNSILNASSSQAGFYNVPPFMSGGPMTHDDMAAASVSGSSTHPMVKPHHVFSPVETSGALASSRHDEMFAHPHVDAQTDTKPSIAEIERSLVLSPKFKKKKTMHKQKRTISFEKYEPERLKVIAKPKRFESLTDPEWQRGLKTAAKSAFARLQSIEGRRPSDAVLARILAGETAKQRSTKRPCFRVQRQNLLSKSPFQVQIGDARMVSQKIIYATYRHIKPSEMGTWQVSQDCLHNDDSWWCFEPTHLKKCEKDHIPAGVPRNKIPAPPDAYFVAKSRRSRSTGASAVVTNAGTASRTTANGRATTGSWTPGAQNGPTIKPEPELA